MTSIESSLLNSFETLANVGTWLVIIGVAGEGVEIGLKICGHKSKNEKFKGFCKKHEFWIEVFGGLFWIMVVIGLVMEHSGNQGAQQIVKRENTRITKEAGEAIRAAGEANERAANAESNTAVALGKVEELRKRNNDLEAQMSPRVFKGQFAAIKRLSEFSGKRVIIFCGHDSPSMQLSQQIAFSFRSAGWQTDLLPFDGIEAGVSTTVLPRGLQDESDIKAETIIAEELNRSDILTMSEWLMIPQLNPPKFKGLVIGIGPKPSLDEAEYMRQTKALEECHDVKKIQEISKLLRTTQARLYGTNGFVGGQSMIPAWAFPSQ